MRESVAKKVGGTMWWQDGHGVDFTSAPTKFVSRLEKAHSASNEINLPRARCYRGNTIKLTKQIGNSIRLTFENQFVGKPAKQSVVLLVAYPSERTRGSCAGPILGVTNVQEGESQ
jgi:hypothetical protein